MIIFLKIHREQLVAQWDVRIICYPPPQERSKMFDPPKWGPKMFDPTVLATPHSIIIEWSLWYYHTPKRKTKLSFSTRLKRSFSLVELLE